MCTLSWKTSFFLVQAAFLPRPHPPAPTPHPPPLHISCLPWIPAQVISTPDSSSVFLCWGKALSLSKVNGSLFLTAHKPGFHSLQVSHFGYFESLPAPIMCDFEQFRSTCRWLLHMAIWSPLKRYSSYLLKSNVDKNSNHGLELSVLSLL